MSVSGVHPVSSKEHMLNPTDIFAVAAHEYKEGLQECAASAKKHGVTPERMSYSIMVQEYSDPSLIRIRAGNTLLTILAFPNRIGFVRGYNGDTADMYISNMVEFFDCARKMGFDTLMCNTTADVVRALKIALRKTNHTGIKSHFDSSSNMFFISTGEARGE